MPFADHRPDPADLARFRALCGNRRWAARLAEIGRHAASASLAGRAAQQRHALELVLARLAEPAALAKAGPAERRVSAFAHEAVRLAATLPAGPRKRLRELIEAGLKRGPFMERLVAQIEQGTNALLLAKSAD